MPPRTIGDLHCQISFFLDHRLEPMFERAIVRRSQHRQAIERVPQPIGRGRVAQQNLVQRDAHAIAEIAVHVTAVGQRDLEVPQRAGLLEAQCRRERLIAGRHVAGLVSGLGRSGD